MFKSKQPLITFLRPDIRFIADNGKVIEPMSDLHLLCIVYVMRRINHLNQIAFRGSPRTAEGGFEFIDEVFCLHPQMRLSRLYPYHSLIGSNCDDFWGYLLRCGEAPSGSKPAIQAAIAVVKARILALGFTLPPTED